MDERLMRTRRVVLKSGIFIGGAALAGVGVVRAADKDKEEEEVSPAEDLMREHGVLKRVLLIYEEAMRRMMANQDLPVETVADSAKIIRNFIEDYHEKLEENFLFPRFEKAGTLTDLVRTLRDQHAAGRRVTDLTLALAKQSTIKNAGERTQLADSLRQFIRMYNPHEAREDTVLFPAFRKIVSANEYASLGEDFEKMVDKVTNIEKTLGIYELAQFTPKV